MTSKIILILFVIPYSVFPFDGQRKGFNAGFGMGISPYATFDRERSVDGENIGLALKLMIGYGFDENNILAYEINTIDANSDELKMTSIGKGLFSVSLYHYFNGIPLGRLFGNAGAGMMDFESKYTNIGGTGLGFKMGIGLEFWRHWQFESYLIWGSTKSNDDRTTDHTILSLLLSAHAF